MLLNPSGKFGSQPPPIPPPTFVIKVESILIRLANES